MVAVTCPCVEKFVIALHVHHKFLFFVRTQPHAGELPITCRAGLILCLHPPCSLIDLGNLERRSLQILYLIILDSKSNVYLQPMTEKNEQHVVALGTSNGHTVILI